MTRTGKAMLLAVLFIGSGLLTYQIYALLSKLVNDETQLLFQLLTALPFAAACSLRFVQVKKWIVPAILLDCITWVIAFRLALAMSSNLPPCLATAIAGMIGALGVTVATGLGCRNLFSLRTLGIAALLGAIAGAPFGLTVNRSAQEALILALSFPLWQVAVGLWMAAASGRLS